jgi:hypothetical protein
VTVGVLALGTLAALLAAAPQADLSLRLESRATRVSPSGAPALSREAVTAQPRLDAWLDGEGLRLSGRYQPRIWTSDVANDTSPLVEHTVGAALETRRPSAWQARLGATATRGTTDPLADALSAATSPATSSTGQLASTTPLAYEALSAAGRASLQLDLRTTVGAGASWGFSRGADAAARTVLPGQRTVGASTDANHLVSLRDTLRLAVDGSWSVTASPLGDLSAAYATASATWRRRLTALLDGWAGAGASLTRERNPGEAASLRALPAGQAGLGRAADTAHVGFQLAARIVPAFDRVDGRVRSTAEGAGTLAWSPARAVTLSTTATAAQRTDGQTSFGAWDARATWLVRERLAVELGVVSRWQRDRRPGVASFWESGAIAAVSWGVGTAPR